MSKEVELKVCPFCGGEAEIEKLHTAGWVAGETPFSSWWVFCSEKNNCQVHPYVNHKSKTNTIRYWNKRAGGG